MVLRLRLAAPGEWEQAKCRRLQVSRHQDAFFDDDPEPAKDFCNGTDDGELCPIRHDCLIFALLNNCSSGVWGGTDEITRRAIRKRYPWRPGNVPRKEWRWMSHEEALAGIDPAELEPDDEDEEDVA